MMDNRVLYAILTILFNQIGVPCFMQGQTKKGILAIVWSIVVPTFGIIALIDFIKGLIVGIKILQMTDEEFAAADKAEFINVIAWGA